MTTNKTMEVKITEDLTLTIDCKTNMGNVNNILHYGNTVRKRRGLQPVGIDWVLTNQDFWKFVIAKDTQDYNERLKNVKPVKSPHIPRDFTMLNEYRDSDGSINYSKLIYKFPTIIKAQRGGKVETRGYWMDLAILLKFGCMLDNNLEIQIYNTFINGEVF